VELQFPFTLSLIRNFGFYRFRAVLARRPPHAEFYRPAHPLHGLEITAGIARLFRDRAVSRGQLPYFLILPERESVEYRVRTGRWPYQPIIDLLAREPSLTVLHFGDSLLAAGAPAALDRFFSETDHYTPLGDEVLARYLAGVFKGHPALR
jgi:hypothetical protein